MLVATGGVGRLIATGLALLGVCTATLLASPRAGAEVSSGFTGSERAGLQQIVDQQLADQGLPGIVVGVWVPGRGSFVDAEGVSDISTGEPIEVVDRMRIASVTKTFTATALLQLVDRGRIALDDPLSKYVKWPNGDEITVRELLNQTSGIYNFVEDEQFIEEFDADPLLPDWQAPRDGLRIARQNPPYFPPGEGFHYSETNYYLAGLITEKLTGKRLEDVIRQRILHKLGLFDTNFPTRPGLRDPFAHGYTGEPGALLDYTRSNPEVPWAAGAMTSTLDDLRVWAKALGTGVPLLKARTQKARLPNVVIETQPIELMYGLGMFSIQGFLGHNGAIFGYSNTVLYLPETGATIVVWTNRGANELGYSDEAAIQIAQLLYPERFP